MTFLSNEAKLSNDLLSLVNNTNVNGYNLFKLHNTPIKEKVKGQGQTINLWNQILKTTIIKPKTREANWRRDVWIQSTYTLKYSTKVAAISISNFEWFVIIGFIYMVGANFNY